MWMESVGIFRQRTWHLAGSDHSRKVWTRKMFLGIRTPYENDLPEKWYFSYIRTWALVRRKNGIWAAFHPPQEGLELLSHPAMDTQEGSCNPSGQMEIKALWGTDWPISYSMWPSLILQPRVPCMWEAQCWFSAGTHSVYSGWNYRPCTTSWMENSGLQFDSLKTPNTNLWYHHLLDAINFSRKWIQ